MKSFLEWFKASTKVKRWICLIIFGIVLTCYGIAKILVSQEVSFMELARIVIIFVVGFIAIVTGIVFIQKRSLEIIIEANNSNSESGKKAGLNIKSLIFNKKVYEEGPKIVVVGGGVGLNIVVQGLKKYTNNITAIVPISDYGDDGSGNFGATGYLPLKDVKDSIIALSNVDSSMNKLFSYNFETEPLRGMNFGDIYLSAMNEVYPNKAEAILKSSEVLNIIGKVIPVTLEEITICAELKDGTTIKQKNKIPEIVSKKNQSINRVYITPGNLRPSPGVIDAIEDADVIIIGPGSLYTNVLPSLLVKSVAKAIKDSRATRFYISNIMTEPGQTEGYTLADHIKTIRDHVGMDMIDYCLADTGEVVPEYIRKYNKDGYDLLELDIKKANQYNVKVIQRNLSTITNGKVRHDGDLIASTIIEMVCNDLKFHDMQNNTQYLLLQSVLKEQRKTIEKEQKRLKKKAEKKKTPEETKPSKFAEKYKDRIKSIQNTDANTAENKKLTHQIEKMETLKKVQMRKSTEQNRKN